MKYLRQDLQESIWSIPQLKPNIYYLHTKAEVVIEYQTVKKGTMKEYS